MKKKKRIKIDSFKFFYKYNILYQFQENFVDVAKLYHKQTGINLTFVPLYIAPRLKKMYIGKGIAYNSENDIAEERKRISACMSEEITDLARSLPLHTVVPYRNLPKKYYLTNKDVSLVPGGSKTSVTKEKK